MKSRIKKATLVARAVNMNGKTKVYKYSQSSTNNKLYIKVFGKVSEVTREQLLANRELINYLI